MDCQAALDMAITFLCSLQYLQWAGLDPMGDADMFWTSPRVKQLYMNHVRVLFNRRNVYTGLLYKVRCRLMLLLVLCRCTLLIATVWTAGWFENGMTTRSRHVSLSVLLVVKHTLLGHLTYPSHVC